MKRALSEFNDLIPWSDVVLTYKNHRRLLTFACAAYLTPPQTPESASPTGFQNPDLTQLVSRMSMKPMIRTCLVYKRLGNEVGLLHVSSFNRSQRPDEYEPYYIPI